MTARRKIPVYSVYNNYKHSPLALGMILAYARADKDLSETFEFIPTLLTSEAEAKRVTAEYGTGVFLCSSYLWSYRANMTISRAVKEWFPDAVTIHGGPSVPKYDYACESFLADHRHVDVTVRGEGEYTMVEILRGIAGASSWGAHTDALGDVAGITYRSGAAGDDTFLRPPDRVRIQDLNTLPSPYLTRWFSTDEAHNWEAAIIETNRGCPYTCTFCDWGSATMTKLRRFDQERVCAELEWIAAHRIRVLFLADANFGILPRDVEIAEVLARLRRDYGYPRQIIASYAKNATERLASIVQIWNGSGIKVDGIISIQSQDPQTLRDVGRSNISTQRYDELIQIFRQERLPLASDVMVGLPGATIESFKSDLQFFVDRNIYARLYATQVLPNSPMAHRDYVEKFKIVMGKDGHVKSTYSYTERDRATMNMIAMCYKVLIGLSVLKYVLYYVQVDHGIKVMTVIDDLQTTLVEHPLSMPQATALLLPMKVDADAIGIMGRFTAEDWRRFYAEMQAFVCERYGVSADSATNTIFQVQHALIPLKNRRLPETITVAHDVVAYFHTIYSAMNLPALANTATKRLIDYPPGTLEISDPERLCDDIGSAAIMYDTHSLPWELDSKLIDRVPAMV